MVFAKILSAGCLGLILTTGTPGQAEIVTIHVEGTVTGSLTKEPEWAPIMDDPIGAPVVASFKIDTDDFTTTVFPLDPLPSPRRGLVFESRVTIAGVVFSKNYVTREPLLPPGTSSHLRVGVFSLGVEEDFGTAPVGALVTRWESMSIDFGFGFPPTAAGLDLRNFELTAAENLFGNSSVSYASGLVVDGKRQTDTGQSIIFTARRIYAAPDK